MGRPFTAEDLWRLGRVGLPAVAPSGRFVVAPVRHFDVAANEGFERLHLLPTNGFPSMALTPPEVSSSHPAIAPDESRLAYVAKPRGAEHAQLHVVGLTGETERKIPVDFPLGCADPHFLPDGKRAIVVAPVLRAAMTLDGTRALLAERATAKVKAHVTEDRVYRFWDRWLTDGAVPHLFVVDLDSGAARDITPDSERWFDFMEDTGQWDLSPDGTEVVFAANATQSPYDRLRAGIFVARVDGGGTRCLTVDNPADDLRPRISPDGRRVLYGMRRNDYYGDRIRLALVDREGRAHRVLTEQWDRSPSEWEWIDDHTIVGCVEERARSKVFTLRVPESGEATDIRMCTHEGTAHGVRVTRGGRAYFQHQSLRAPPEIWSCSLEGDPALERLTHVNDGVLADVDFGEVEEIVFDGADGDAVQMLVVRPPGFDPGKKWPLVHLIHGGPYGVFGDTFHFRWNVQLFASPGYVVATVNFHGSSSFGEKFSRSILGDWGGKPATDIERATDVLVARGFIDPSRMAIAGGSYGGYMTCWLASQTKRYKCAVAHAAVFNFTSLYGSDVTQGDELEFGGVPWGGEEALRTIRKFDPSSFAAGYETPMLVLHGEKDYRVPSTHALDLYGVLKAKGVPARLVYYPDENHWILKPQNSLHWYREVHGWLARWLG